MDSETHPAGRPCCDDGACIRKDISNLLDPEAPIEDRIVVAATAVARTCGSLNPQELETCVSRLFEVPVDCRLSKSFVIAYQTERDALDGRREIEERRAGKAAHGFRL